MTDLKNTPQRWWLLVLLTTGMIFCYAHRSALSVAAPFMIVDLDLSTAAMGALLSAFFWSYSVMQVPAGWLVDRFGVRKAYGIGFALWSIASVFTGFAGSLTSLAALRVLLGIGQAAAFPASARAVSNWFKEAERGTVTGGYLTGVRVGQALVSAAGALLITVSGLRYFFIFLGLVPMIWLIPWWLFLRRWEGAGTERVSGINPPAAKRSLSFVQSLALLRLRSVLGIFVGFFAYDYVWYVFVSWLPSYLVLERDFSPQEMALYSSVPFIVMSVVVFLSGLLSDALVRRGYPEVIVRKSLIVLGLGLAGLIVPAGLVEDKMHAVWLLSVSLCGLGIATPNTWTLTQAISPRDIVGTVSSIQNFGGNLGGVLAPALTGFIAHVTHSFALALSLTGAILALGIYSYVFVISARVRLPELKGN